jgi:hypothetical protein
MWVTFACATANFLTHFIISIAVLENVPKPPAWQAASLDAQPSTTPLLSQQHFRIYIFPMSQAEILVFNCCMTGKWRQFVFSVCFYFALTIILTGREICNGSCKKLAPPPDMSALIATGGAGKIPQRLDAARAADRQSATKWKRPAPFRGFRCDHKKYVTARANTTFLLWVRERIKTTS